MNTREAVMALRRKAPEMKASEIAAQVGVSRERVRQILLEEGLATKAVRSPKSQAKTLHRPEYQCWWAMLDRCSNPKSQSFHYYGGRGIGVCLRWRVSFENFLADMGPKPSAEHSIDRIDNDGNYEPSNCRWATQKEQMANRRRPQRKHRERPAKRPSSGRPPIEMTPEELERAEAIWRSREHPNDKARVAAIEARIGKRLKRGWLWDHFGSPSGRQTRK